MASCRSASATARSTERRAATGRAATGSPLPAAKPRRQGAGERATSRPSSLADARTRPRATPRSTARNTRPSRTLDRLEAWIARAHDTGVVAIDTETTSARSDAGRICAASRSPSRRTKPATCRSAIATASGDGGDLFAAKRSSPDQIPERDALAALKPLLEDQASSRSARTQVRLAGARPARHRARRLRRHHADVLRARRRHRRPRHGRARQALARPRADPLRATSPAPARRRSRFDRVADRARRPTTPPRTPT